MATVAGAAMVGTVNTTVWTGCAATGGVVAEAGVGNTVVAAGAMAAGAAGRFAAASTVVIPKTPDAASPVTMMRAPAAAWGRRERLVLVGGVVRRVGAGACGCAAMNAAVAEGGAQFCWSAPRAGEASTVGISIGAWPRLARMAAIRAAWFWSVIVGLLVLVVALAMVAAA